MAATPITIVGIETRDDGTSGNVTIVGMASITGLGVGGGPAVPPGQPTHPIVIPPGPDDPHPAHPIVIPEPPTEPPIDVPPGPPVDDMVKPPPAGGGWGFNPMYGWGYFPGAGGKGPK